MSRRAGAGSSSGQRQWQSVPSGATGIWLSLPLIIFLALFVVYPVGKVIVDSLLPGPDGFVEHFESSVNRRVLWATLRGSGIVTMIAVIGGACLAWFLRVTRSSVLKVIVWLAVLSPLWMGVVVKNYAFTLILGRRGALNRSLETLGLTSQPLDLLFTDFAVITGVLYSMLPFAIVPLYVAFQSIELDLIKAAESLGASRTRAMKDIVVPIALPSIFASACIVYVISIGFYITPVLLGGARNPWIATLIEDDIFRYFDYNAAAVKSTILLAVAFASVGAALLLVGRERLQKAIR